MLQQMDQLAKQYWYIVVGGIGVLLVLGAVFKWKWVLQSDGGRPFGFLYWILDFFGPSGYRVTVGAIGVFIVIFAVIYPLLLGNH